MVNAKISRDDMESIDVLDKQIEVLLGCKPLPEDQIKQLCAKVSPSATPGASSLPSFALGGFPPKRDNLSDPHSANLAEILEI